MSAQQCQIAPIVVMIAPSRLTSCACEPADYSYPAYYYDGRLPMGSSISITAAVAFGRFHHDFDHRFGATIPSVTGFAMPGHSFSRQDPVAPFRRINGGGVAAGHVAAAAHHRLSSSCP